GGVLEARDMVEQAGFARHIGHSAGRHRPLSARAVVGSVIHGCPLEQRVTLGPAMDDDRMVTVNNPGGVEATHLRIAELVQELHSRADADSDTVPGELVEHAAIEVPGAQYAGVPVTRNAKQIDTPAATHKWPILLDEIQQRHREGPCLTAAWEERPVYVADLETDGRFPRYSQDALEQTPLRSIMAFQMFIAGETMGAL